VRGVVAAVRAVRPVQAQPAMAARAVLADELAAGRAVFELLVQNAAACRAHLARLLGEVDHPADLVERGLTTEHLAQAVLADRMHPRFDRRLADDGVRYPL